MVLIVHVPEVRSEGNDKVIDAVTGVVCSEYHCSVLPVIFFGAAVRAMFAYLDGGLVIEDIETKWYNP